MRVKWTDRRAEHDDYHLARISELKKLLAK